MPPKMVHCILCKNIVSKRKSISLEALGAGQGRACRKHPEIQELLEALYQDEHIKTDIPKIGRKIRVISAAAMICALHTFQKIQPILLYARLEQAGYTKKMLKQVRNKVKHMGGPNMSESDVLTQVLIHVESIRNQEQ